MFDHVPAERGAVREIEGAAPGLGERGARRGNDDGINHGALLLVAFSWRSASSNVFPAAASCVMSFAGFQNAGCACGFAANSFMRRTTWPRPTRLAWNIGPPRCTGNP